MTQATLLIVEDQAVVAADLGDRLISNGYKVCGMAVSSEEALALARRHRPELALMDIRIQGEMDGIQTAEVLRRELDVPVIFLSAHSDEPTLQRAKFAAPYGFLVKPFDERELQLNIEVALHKHEGERRLTAAHEQIRQLNASLEQRVRERTAELEAALTEIEGVVQAVAHHLRSPLRAMEGYSHLLLTRYAEHLPDPASRFPEAIGSSAQRMARLVDDLLLFLNLRQQALCPARVDVAAVVREILDELIAAAPGRNVEAHIEALPAAQADPALLRQVMVELLSNALKFSGDREPAIITAGVEPAADRTDQHVYFVRDNGIGFDARYAHKLFKLFSQLNLPEAYEGTGAGLAKARRIVERMGGPHLGGAVIRRGCHVFLQPSRPTMNSPAPDILLVEDSQSDVELFMLAHELNKSVATIGVARDGVEALELLLGGEGRSGDAQESLPRLVLLDLNMPRLNGFEVLDRLRADERTRRLPVVILSASDERSDALQAHRLGANGYLRKPARFENLRAVLAELERDWLKA